MTRQQPQHPDVTESAALYMSGAMTPDEQQAIERELEQGEPALRDELQGLDTVVRGLSELTDPIVPDPATRDVVMRMAAPLGAVHEGEGRQVWRDWQSDDERETDLFTLPATAGDWASTGIDGIEVRRLFIDREANRMTAMFRMAPGTEYVPHVHDGPEECYVLEGDLHVGDDIVMHAGDYQRAPAGSHHGVQRTEGGCLLLISSSLTDKVA